MRGFVLSVVFVTACGGAEKPGRPPRTASSSEKTLLTLPRLVADPPLEGSRILGLSISPDAEWLMFLKGSEKDSEVLDLWGLPLSEAQAGAKPRPLVRATDIIKSGEEKLSEQERMARERKRIRLKGLVSYSFCGEDGHNLLFTLGGNLYHVVPKAPKPEVTQLTSDGGAKLDVRCSPKGSLASFIKDNEVWAVDVKTKKVSQLTKGASKTVSHGVAEFVAMEEMGRYDGHWWSKDERYLAYMEVDVAPVSVKVRPQIHANKTDMVEQRYPAAGEPNAKVRVRVLDVKTGEDTLLATPEQDGYLPRVNWFGDNDLYVQWQSRDQKLLVLFRGKAPKFRLEKVLEDNDPAWVDLHHDLRVLKDGSMLWPSVKSGVRQLDRIDKDGKRSQLTKGADPMLGIEAVDEAAGLVFFERGTERSRERQLFSVSLQTGEEKQVTQGAGTHGVSAHRGGKAFIETSSDLKTPSQTRVLGKDGHVIFELDRDEAVPWKQLQLPETEWLTVKAEDGTDLNGLLIHPMNQDSGKKYPVLVSVYGGPGAQRVMNAYGVLSSFFVYLSQQGFGVFVLDNRGSANRDHAFSRAFYKHFADIEIKDQIAGARALAKIPWVDPTRLGVWGWSYGGTLTALLMTEENTPFAAGVSGAPVTDWRLYDTHYTERYLGTPAENAKGYEQADVVRRASRLKKPMLLVHGTADDNVLFENSLRLVEALQKHSIPFELMIYPGHAHGVQGREAQLHLYRMIATFFARHLGVTLNPASL